MESQKENNFKTSGNMTISTEVELDSCKVPLYQMKKSQIIEAYKRLEFKLKQKEVMQTSVMKMNNSLRQKNLQTTSNLNKALKEVQAKQDEILQMNIL